MWLPSGQQVQTNICINKYSLHYLNIDASKVLFPASAVGRKGAYEIKQFAIELNLELLVLGKMFEGPNFWDGIKTKKFTGDWSKIGLVIYPTYVEHQPRLILKALSRGIPVITTEACGIDASELVQIVKTGDFEELRKTVNFI